MTQNSEELISIGLITTTLCQFLDVLSVVVSPILIGYSEFWVVVTYTVLAFWAKCQCLPQYIGGEQQPARTAFSSHVVLKEIKGNYKEIYKYSLK